MIGQSRDRDFHHLVQSDAVDIRRRYFGTDHQRAVLRDNIERWIGRSQHGARGGDLKAKHQAINWRSQIKSSDSALQRPLLLREFDKDRGVFAQLVAGLLGAPSGEVGDLHFSLGYQTENLGTGGCKITKLALQLGDRALQRQKCALCNQSFGGKALLGRKFCRHKRRLLSDCGDLSSNPGGLRAIEVNATVKMRRGVDQGGPSGCPKPELPINLCGDHGVMVGARKHFWWKCRSCQSVALRHETRIFSREFNKAAFDNSKVGVQSRPVKPQQDPSCGDVITFPNEDVSDDAPVRVLHDLAVSLHLHPPFRDDRSGEGG